MEHNKGARPVVLITGGSRGIGAATARRFAQSGWDVAINYHHSQEQAQFLTKELQQLGIRAVSLQGDVAQPDQAQALIRQAEESLGPLEALVCNAGIAPQQMLLTDLSAAAWQRTMAVNLDSAFFLLQAALPGFVQRKRGSIVTVSSMWGITGGSCEAAYSASKAGIIGLTRAMAKELGPSHIRVNCVAPGVIATDMNAHLSQEDFEALAQETPLCRIGQPEEVAEAIFFLASSSASFITGQVLSVDGGIVI